jgi:hypothetical protein
MRADLPALLPLICPVCRHLSARGRELFTLSVAQVLRSTGGEDEGSPEDIEEGILVCDNPQVRPPLSDSPRHPGRAHGSDPLCGKPAAGAELLSMSRRRSQRWQSDGPDDAALPRMLDYLSIYTSMPTLGTTQSRHQMVLSQAAAAPCCGKPIDARKIATVERSR